MKILNYLVFVFFISAHSFLAEGACTTPAGIAGQLSYNSSVMQYCDNTTWKNMRGLYTGTCSSAGLTSFTGTDINFCNGTSTYSMKSSNIGTCATTGITGWNGAVPTVCISTTLYSMAPTYATWNSLDIGANASLSNGDLTLTSTNYTSGAARSTVGKSAGKWYWEIKRTSQTATGVMIGVGQSNVSLTWPGEVAGSYSLDSYGHTWNNSVDTTGYSAAFGINTIIGIALDMDAGSITYYINGVSQGIAYTGLSGTFYAMNSNWGGPTTETMEANFGASPFVYPPPAGFNPGLF